MNSFSNFDGASAVNGNSTTRVSDHLPVVADFLFRPNEGEGPTPLFMVRIRELLPNPIGTDLGQELIRP